MKYTFLDREVELSDQEILSIVWKGVVRHINDDCDCEITCDIN